MAAAPGVAGSRLINLGWIDNASNETAQYLQQSSDGISWKALATLSANVLSYRHSGLTAGKTYLSRIRSYNSAGGYSAFSKVDFSRCPVRQRRGRSQRAWVCALQRRLISPSSHRVRAATHSFIWRTSWSKVSESG